MKRLILAAGLALFALQAPAAPTCQAMAAEKKLAGAARNASLRRCLQDTTGVHSNATCEAAAEAKGLSGAARSSHVKKCMREG